MQIQPREYFTIARGLQDPSDLTTYYVQAVVRNARTDALIDTVNLTDNGNRRFTKPWQAPADVSGDGLYILITISVYTDAAYSVRADNYGDSFDEHLIQARPTPAMLAGGPGGPDIDYIKIQRIIEASFADFQPIEVTNKIVDFGSVIKAIEDNKVKIEPTEKVNLEPINNELKGIGTTLAELSKRPKFEKTVIPDLTEKFNEINNNLEAIKHEILQRIETLPFSKIEQDTIKNEVQGLWKLLEKFITIPQKEVPKDKEDPILISNQMANEK